jgi:acyl transferase domain-containing protein
MMGRVGDAASEQAALMTALGRLWTLGVDIDLRAVWMHRPRLKCSLPLYPFEHVRYWIDPPATATASWQGGQSRPVADGPKAHPGLVQSGAAEISAAESLVKGQLSVLAQQIELLRKIDGEVDP